MSSKMNPAILDVQTTQDILKLTALFGENPSISNLKAIKIVSGLSKTNLKLDPWNLNQ